MFKIGADPEFFLKDKSTGKFVSAHGIVPGTKRQPLPVEGGAVQVDGMALEFNINPAETYEEFSKNIKVVLKQLREMVDPQLEFAFEPVAHFGKEYIDSQPDVAKELGCEPDYNAWTSQINPKPNADLGFRTASGHVHIGWTNQQDITHAEHIEACEMMVKQLDFYLGVPALLWDHDTVRSSMYGAPGAYRPKHYGVEYRTLSNVWLKSEDTIRYVFNQSLRAAEMLMAQNRAYSYGIDVNVIKNTYRARDVYDVIQAYTSFNVSADINYIAELRKTERPIIIERLKKMNEEMYMSHKKTGELVPYEEATPSNMYTHPNDYVRLCHQYNLEKPKSVNNARVIYEKYISAMLVENAAPKKRSKATKTADYAMAYSPATWSTLYTGLTTNSIAGNQAAIAVVDDIDLQEI